MGCIKSKQHLSQDDLDFLKTYTCYDENNIKVWHTTFMQDSPDGRLTQGKFLQMHEVYFPGDFCHNFFKTFDTRHKGYLNFKEYLLAINMTNAETPEDKLKLAFRMFDLDGNGELRSQSFTSLIADLRQVVNRVPSFSRCLNGTVP